MKAWMLGNGIHHPLRLARVRKIRDEYRLTGLALRRFYRTLNTV